MKRLLLIIIIHFSSLTCQPWLVSNCFAQQYGWTDISSNVPGDSLFHDLSDLYFVSDNVGWITSSSHPEIYRTTDGGLTFTTNTTTLTTNAIHMVSATEGYCGGASGFVYRTTDGGTTWPFRGTIPATLIDISFPPGGGTGYACGFNGVIYSVTSAGVTAMTSGVNGDLSSISFPINSTEGWVCGGSVIRHYAGASWVGDQFKTSGDYNSIYFTDSQNGWSVGDRIIHTTDGQNWAEQTNPDTLGRAMLDIFLLNATEGWIVGNQGLILHTTNGGANWTVEADGLTTTLLTGVQFTSSTNGYIVGNNKTLLKYTQLTSVEDEKELPTEFNLKQNYPNPFNPSTKIKFTIPSNVKGEMSNVVLKVFDILGNEIATLVNEEKPVGVYNVQFTMNNLSSGIYFYQLKAGDYLETKKMVLTK